MPKSIRKTEKSPKNPLFWAKKPKKTPKTTGLGFKKKNGFFPTLLLFVLVFVSSALGRANI
jgi:hypothetical protein